jgi:hypothetical protein
LAVFVSPKADFRSDGDQLEDKAFLKDEIKKPLKGYYPPLRGITLSSFGTPTFSYATPEG